MQDIRDQHLVLGLAIVAILLVSLLVQLRVVG